VLAFKKTNYKRVLRLSSYQLIEDFNNAIDIMNKSFLLIINLKLKYIITKIYNNKSKNRICFNISNQIVTYINYKIYILQRLLKTITKREKIKIER